jgi:hypothetical protein
VHCLERLFPNKKSHISYIASGIGMREIHERLTGYEIEQKMLGLYPIRGLPDITIKNSSTASTITSGIEPLSELKLLNESDASDPSSEVNMIELVDPSHKLFPNNKIGETISKRLFACYLKTVKRICEGRNLSKEIESKGLYLVRGSGYCG